MEFKDQVKEALIELRKTKERKFDQTVELIVNLQKFNVKKENINLIITVPHNIKEKKIAAFLETKSPLIDTITEAEFNDYKDKKSIKKLVDKYDFFISQAKLMPKVATAFGKVLGPVGKMPSPQLGIIPQADDKIIADFKSKVNKSVKLRTKESSIKLPIGKQSMKDEDIVDNVLSVYNALLKALPKEKENIKNVEIKLTMAKPVKIKLR